MDQTLLSSRAIIGAYFARLEASPGMAWINGVSNLFNSDQAAETYGFLGQSPAMREWLGGRQARGLGAVNNFAIANKHYEGTLRIEKKDVRRDKTGQIMARVQEFADRAQTHWASLLATLITAGDSTTCYDGQYFFDTDHTEGDNTTNQSNSLTYTLASEPHIGTGGTTTSPGIDHMGRAMLKTITAMLAFKDNRGEPMNENASSFLAYVPAGLYADAAGAVSNLMPSALQLNMNPNLVAGLNVTVQMSARSTWTTKFAMFRTDSPIKGLIRQSEQDVELKAKAEGSEFEFDEDAWEFGIDAWRNVGYGYWQRACLSTFA